MSPHTLESLLNIRRAVERGLNIAHKENAALVDSFQHIINLAVEAASAEDQSISGPDSQDAKTIPTIGTTCEQLTS